MDGDSNTRWATGTIGNGIFTIDLGKELVIEEIAIDWQSPTPTGVEISTDGQFYQPISNKIFGTTFDPLSPNRSQHYSSFYASHRVETTLFPVGAAQAKRARYVRSLL